MLGEAPLEYPEPPPASLSRPPTQPEKKELGHAVAVQAKNNRELGLFSGCRKLVTGLWVCYALFVHHASPFG